MSHPDMMLRESLVKSTKILAGKNVKVLMEGFAPRVAFDPATKQPTEIVLPMIPDGCPKDLVDAIKGYQDHECYHILYSSFDDICDGKMSSSWHYMHNVVDDNHINARGARDFPGTHIELINAYRYLFDNMDAYKDANIDAAFAKNKKGATVGYLVSWVARHMNSDFTAKWYDASPLPKHYADLDAKLPDELKKRLGTCHTPEDVRWCTDALLDFLKDYQDEIEKMAKASEKSKGFGKGKMKKGDDKGKGKGEGEEGKEKGKGSGKPGDEEGEGEGSGSEEDYDEDAAPMDTEDYPGSFEDGLRGTIGQNIKIKFKEQKGTFFWSERMNEIIGPEEYKGHSRGRADITSSVGLDKFDMDCKAVSSYLRKRLERLLESKQRVYYTPGYKSGKLTGKNLHSVPAGNTHVFSKKNDIRALNAAVGLLIDLSGSMGGSKVKLASQCAYTMGDCLDKLKIPFEALGFWTDCGVTVNGGELSRAWGEFCRDNDPSILKRVVNETSINTTFVFKDFHSSFGLREKASLMAASKGLIGMHQNEDASHLKVALERLSKMPQEKKVLFVFSDGSPAYCGSNTQNGRTKLKELAEAALRDYGVTVVGIGIECTNVKDYYKNTKVITNLEELPTTVFEVLTAQLLNRK